MWNGDCMCIYKLIWSTIIYVKSKHTNPKWRPQAHLGPHMAMVFTQPRTTNMMVEYRSGVHIYQWERQWLDVVLHKPPHRRHIFEGFRKSSWCVNFYLRCEFLKWFLSNHVPSQCDYWWVVAQVVMDINC